MTLVHTIRLRGPWGCEPLTRFVSEDGVVSEVTTGLPAAAKLQMPADWSVVCGAHYRGRVRFRRPFQWPTRLTPREQIWLLFDRIRGHATATLNGHTLQPVGQHVPAQCCITDKLEPSNLLIVEVTHPHPPTVDSVEDAQAGGSVGDVYLEVRTE